MKKKPRYYKHIDERELEELLDGIINMTEEDYSLNDEDDTLLEFLDDGSIQYLKKMDVHNALETTLTSWYVHQGIHMSNENYEMCAKIRDVIKIEIEQTIYILETHFKNLLTQEDYHMIDQMDKDKREIAYKICEELNL